MGCSTGNKFMVKIIIAGCAALLLCACGHSQAPASTVAPSAASTASAAATAISAPASAVSSLYAGDQPDEVTPPLSAAELSADMLDKILASPTRSKADKALDADRHPERTLAFFGLRPDMNVIEVEPGRGWYAAILAPLLKQNGSYTAAMLSPLASPQAAAAITSLRKTFAADPGRYGRAQLASFDSNTPNLGTPGSADMVLSFRDVHRWVAKGTAGVMFRAVYNVLRPGGVFGVVDNRVPADTDIGTLKGMPYLRQVDVVKLAVAAGFQLDAASNINADPEDADATPSQSAPADADRMTLRFVKPDKAPALPASASSV